MILPAQGLTPSGRSPRSPQACTWLLTLLVHRAVLTAKGECIFKLTKKGPGLWGPAVEAFFQILRNIQV